MFENSCSITNEALKYVSLSSCESLNIFGRTADDLNPLVLFWTSSGVEVCVKAGELWVEVESSYNIYEPWISYTVNGALIGRQMLPKGRYFLPLIRGMNPDEEKVVRIFKDVQAMSADDGHCLKIYGFLTDGSFCPVPERKLKIEFIGDSITSGEGVIGAKKEQDWISMFFDSVHSYTNLTAQALDADYHVISQSGWGVLTGWDNNPGCNIPDHYSQLCGLVFGRENESYGAHLKYNFSGWSPDVIVVNLGTNDGGAFNSSEFTDPVTGKRTKQRLRDDGTMEPDDERRLKDKCKQFLGELRFYNPDSRILWAYGMLGLFVEKPVTDAINEFKAEQNDRNVFYVRLEETTDETVGSRCHPGFKNHQLAADTLVKKITQILGL